MNRQNHIHLAALLLVILTAAFACATASAAGFADVAQNHWAYSSIQEASSDGVIKGVGNNKFDPNGNVTYAQFTAILTRMMYPSEVEASSATGEWWAKNAAVAKAHNFFEYMGNVDMNRALTREEMAHIIYNAYPNKLYERANTDAALDEGLEKIPDAASLNESYMYSVAFCYNKGILQGVDKAGNFSPKATLTRAQTAAIYVRIKSALAGSTPAETPSETPAPIETPATADQRDLNEWGIPHFRMLEGENVQQMMDRINAVTPPYRAGYLTNGKPITEENIQEMLDAVIADMPEGSRWDEQEFYRYDNSKVWLTSGRGCNSYAACVSDYVFGEDAPMSVHKDFNTLKVGDVMWARATVDGGHLVVITEIVWDEGSPYGFYGMSGNSSDEVSDGDGGLLAPFLDKNNPFAQHSNIWSRY